ncbi:hypothetical protein [Glaciibacter superstes]|uniref:hypothetical protein n=1 Tax=Glaciibacter superstes TaxID=501023 RepID=UPI0003B43467|nr:hypothetical protein [Glaciibacter superstes]
MSDRRNVALIALWILATVGLGIGVAGQIVVTLMRLSPSGMYSVFGGAALDYQLLDQVIGIAGYVLPALVRAGLLSVVALLFFSALQWRRRTAQRAIAEP